MDNQTPDEWLTLDAVSSNPEALGTGLFLFPGNSKAIIHADLTYDRCRNVASTQKVKAFKWAPHVVASFTDVQNTVCNERCSQRCVKPGCICDTESGICISP